MSDHKNAPNPPSPIEDPIKDLIAEFRYKAETSAYGAKLIGDKAEAVFRAALLEYISETIGPDEPTTEHSSVNLFVRNRLRMDLRARFGIER